ncbi:hypothetical protein [Pseudomonas rubra]|uniref:SpaO N-terminal domain-containing protein n=1 Tax=Pseudomonas rubra TaxID=2942627 RepID=A0ABT5PCU8_9PSED|nr:hypothetical protein [Pseudomonas rubra]MDD1016011.1 hypothetical protein [Pseudomonas rubra]MDD1039218.1 hypothetical protein [Pseudomonas rubra]MDD1155188.1 hypothetical protein [Pseudomonas rubra]
MLALKPFALRHLHGQSSVQRRLLRHQPQLRLEAPPQDRACLQFSAESVLGRWSGLVVAHDWLALRMPKLPGLLSRPCSEQQVLQLFEALAQPVPPPLPALVYERMDSVRLLPGSECTPWPLLMSDTAVGRLWLSEVPAALLPPDPASAQAAVLPTGLELLLGLSQWQPAAEPQVGDLLRILDFTPHWRLHGRFGGPFGFIDQGIQMTTVDSCNAEHTGQSPLLATLPVTLEFSLPAVNLSFAELARCLEAGLLNLDPQALQQVRANGQWLGCGELVYVGEQIALELQQVRGGGEHE